MCDEKGKNAKLQTILCKMTFSLYTRSGKILCSDMDHILSLFHYLCVNITKSEKVKSERLLVPVTLNKR